MTAMMRASIVLPVPGGPVNRTPLIGLAPIATSLFLFFSGTSISSRALATTAGKPPKSSKPGTGVARTYEETSDL